MAEHDETAEHDEVGLDGSNSQVLAASEADGNQVVVRAATDEASLHSSIQPSDQPVPIRFSVGHWLFRLPLMGKRLRNAYTTTRENDIAWRLDWLDQTSAIETAEADRIRPAVRESVDLAMAYNSWLSVLRTYVDNAMALSIFLGIIAVLALSAVTVAGSLVWRPIIACCALLVWAVVSLVGIGALDLRNAKLQLATAASVFVGTFLAIRSLPEGGSFIWSALRIGLMVGLLTFTAFALLFTAEQTVYIVLWRRKRGRYPYDELVNTLCWNLRNLEEPSAQRIDTLHVRSVVSEFEYLAELFERDFSRPAASAHPSTIQWIRSEAGARAAAVRMLQRRLLLPTEDARQEVVQWLGRALVHAADGSWADIPTATSSDQEASVVGRSAKAIKYAFVSIIPLVGVLAARYTGVVESDAVLGTLLTFAFAWFGTQLLSALDPSASRRLEDTATVTKLLSRKE